MLARKGEGGDDVVCIAGLDDGCGEAVDHPVPDAPSPIGASVISQESGSFQPRTQ